MVFLAFEKNLLVDLVLIDSPVQGSDELDPRLGDVPFLSADEPQGKCIGVVLFKKFEKGRAHLIARQLFQQRVDGLELRWACIQALEC